MAQESTSITLAKNLHTLYLLGSVGRLTDGDLLERVVAGRDSVAEAAFAVLVERHAPMVLRVCRETLGAHDAQDAFQATFLVFFRRAASVQKRDSVASWLYGVARRVALRAKADEIRRRIHERRGATEVAGSPHDDADEPGSCPELHEEISRLPERYREPVVLCYLEGLTTEAVAHRAEHCPQAIHSASPGGSVCGND